MYASSPIRPCSAAIVIAIVCDAASVVELCGCRLRYSVTKAAEPYPHNGLALNMSMPPETRPARPLEAPLRPWLSPNVFGEAATASMADTTIAGDDPYATFNATVGAVTKGAYDGPMRLLGGGPERVAKVIERALKRSHPPARITITPSAKVTIAMRRLLPDRAWDAMMRQQFPQPG